MESELLFSVKFENCSHYLPVQLLLGILKKKKNRKFIYIYIYIYWYLPMLQIIICTGKILFVGITLTEICENPSNTEAFMPIEATNLSDTLTRGCIQQRT